MLSSLDRYRSVVGPSSLLILSVSLKKWLFPQKRLVKVRVERSVIWLAYGPCRRRYRRNQIVRNGLIDAVAGIDVASVPVSVKR
jgi:hypothetical protein